LLEEITEPPCATAPEGDEQFIGSTKSKLKPSFEVGCREGFSSATRELPERYITLRHKHRIVSRWNGPGH